MNKWILGTFVTENTPYEEVFEQHLKKSIDKHNLRYLIAKVPNSRSWNKNVAQKPYIILDQLGQIGDNECLVFLDADSEINHYPKLFDEIPDEYDLAYYTLNWRQWYGYSQDYFELLTGTMFFRNRAIVKSLCWEWYNQSIKSHMWEQKILQDVIKDFKVNAYPLPIEYCFMNSRPGGLKPLVDCNPIITHFQVSRDLKKLL